MANPTPHVLGKVPRYRDFCYPDGLDNVRIYEEKGSVTISYEDLFTLFDNRDEAVGAGDTFLQANADQFAEILHSWGYGDVDE